MKYLDGNYYVEVKDHRYKFHPTENKNIPQTRSSNISQNSVSSSKRDSDKDKSKRY